MTERNVTPKKEDVSLGAAIFGLGLIGLGVPAMYAVIVIAFIPVSVAAAWCDMHLWNWFVSPYLKLPQMGLWVSFGLGMWMRMNTFDSRQFKDHEMVFWQSLYGSVFRHASSLFVGYLVWRFVLGGHA